LNSLSRTSAVFGAAALAWLAACGEQPAPQELASIAVGAGLADAGVPNEIAFDHRLHAGTYQMPCLSCHVYASESPVAGLPSGRKCMGCHKFVAKEKPAVKLLAERVAAGEPLRWRRVFAVPDFIYFSHRVHVGASPPVACSECHGAIAAAAVVQQERPFTMGRCLECHESRQARLDCLACHK
jgi:hypothetical protein